MRRVDRLTRSPHKCAVFPQIGPDHPKGFFDTGNELPGWDDHVYVSVEAVEQMARELGWASPSERAEQQAENAALSTRVEQLEEDLKEYDRRFEAIDVLESAEFRARKKPGRPKKEQT